MGSNTTSNISLPGNHTNILLSTASLSPSSITLWMSIYASICLCGTLTNLLIIGLILSHQQLRTSCGILISHSLVSHTVLLAVSHPILVASVGIKQLAGVSVDPRYCGLIMWFHMTCRYAGNFIETHIAMNRVVALCLPYKYRSFTNRTLENSVIVACWAGSGLLACLGCFDLGVEYIVVSAGNCSQIQKGALGVVTFVVGYYLPFALTGAGYILVNLKMLVTKRQRSREVTAAIEGVKQQKLEKRRLTMANMVFVACVWNTMCYLGVPIAINVTPWVRTKQPMVTLWLGVLQVIGYATEPLIFFAMNAEYRAQFLRTFRKITSAQEEHRGASRVDYPMDLNTLSKSAPKLA